MGATCHRLCFLKTDHLLVFTGAFVSEVAYIYAHLHTYAETKRTHMCKNLEGATIFSHLPDIWVTPPNKTPLYLGGTSSP